MRIPIQLSSFNSYYFVKYSIISIKILVSK